LTYNNWALSAGTVAVNVGVMVGVSVGRGVNVAVGVRVGVSVGTGEGVLVGGGVGVGVDVGVGIIPQPDKAKAAMLKKQTIFQSDNFISFQPEQVNFVYSITSPR
jgi:hypothetical protein